MLCLEFVYKNQCGNTVSTKIDKLKEICGDILMSDVIGS